MPQRPTVPIVPTKGMNLTDNIREAWMQKHFRPTVAFIGVRNTDERVYEIPLVNYANGPASQLILPQGIIKRNQSMQDAVWELISDAFLIERAKKGEQRYPTCLGYYDHVMQAGRAPEGFKKGKRLYFVTMDIDGMTFAWKDSRLQRDENPVVTMTFLCNLGPIRNALSSISHEGKRWASIGMIEDALQQRFDRDCALAAKKPPIKQVA